jgi:hypothetical protein
MGDELDRFTRDYAERLTIALTNIAIPYSAHHVQQAGASLETLTPGDRAHLAVALAEAAWRASCALVGEPPTCFAFYSRLDLNAQDRESTVNGA